MSSRASHESVVRSRAVYDLNILYKKRERGMKKKKKKKTNEEEEEEEEILAVRMRP